MLQDLRVTLGQELTLDQELTFQEHMGRPHTEHHSTTRVRFAQNVARLGLKLTQQTHACFQMLQG